MKRLLAVTALVVLAATGCGGGSTGLKAAASPSASTSTEPSSLVPSLLPSTAASLLAGLASNQCQEIATKFSQASSAFSAGDKTRTPSQTFALLSEAMSTAADKVDRDDVAAAFDYLAKAYKTLSDGLKGVDYTPGSGAAPPPAYLSAARSLATPELLAASKTVTSYFATGCK